MTAARKLAAKRTRGRLPRPTRGDLVSGLVTGLFSVPEGMAYASIGGFNPVLGLYSGMTPTLVGSLFSRTALMITTLTSAIALSSKSVLASAHLDPNDLGNVATLTLMVGIVMALFGVLRMGAMMGFVSTAVMTGFTTGIAVQIVAGVIGDATGYSPDMHNTLAKLGQGVGHIADWDGTTVTITIATVLLWAIASRIRVLRPLATLVSLVVMTIVVWTAGVDVEVVSDIAKVPRSLPMPVLPDVDQVPHLAAGAVAIALVALAQAAGIAAAVPNPDGTRPSPSADFTAQGLANIAGGFFRALPAGGSLSRTGVASSAGARTRWCGVFAAAWLALLVVALGPVLGHIPMPVIGGLVMVIGVELVVGRWRDIRLVLETSIMSAAAMVFTFLATTQLPLQDAIFLGAGLSLLLFCVGTVRHASLVGLAQGDDGRWQITEPPPTAPDYSVTVLLYRGAALFAELNHIDATMPDVTGSRGAAIVLALRTLPDVPSSTLLILLERRADQLRNAGNRLYLAGVSPQLLALLNRTGALAHLGRDSVFAETPTVFEAIDAAVEAAHTWAEGQRDPAARVSESDAGDSR
jgi:SulP family sulfate permease